MDSQVMKGFTPPTVDAGMFQERPEMRHLRWPGNWKSSRWRQFVDQTDLVRFVENLVSDPALAEQFEPVPIEQFAMSFACMEAVQLPSGQWLGFDAIYSEYMAGCLVEAPENDQVAVLQATCQPRQVTQWWLICEPEFCQIAEREGIPLLISADGRSKWIGTYDEEPKEFFYQTSIGACFSHIEATVDAGTTIRRVP